MDKTPSGDKADETSDDSSLGAAGSLEFESENKPDTNIVSSADEQGPDTVAPMPDGSQSQKPTEAPERRHILSRLWQHFNIYLLLMLLIVVLAGIVTVVTYLRDKSAKGVGNGELTQQDLPAETLQELASNGVQVGDPKQVLNIQSNSVFAGAVLVKGELQVAGGLKIGNGSLSLPEVNVGGSAIINDLQTQNLDVAGGSRLNDVSVLRNLSVTGNGTFSGSLTTSSLSVGRLQLNGDLNITRHLLAGGASPGRTNGSALGSGGTTSVSGSDTAGSVTINTGGSPAPGCFITVNFAAGYSSVPHVIVTPVGSSAASLNYYVNRTAGNFSVCSANSAPGNSSFGFDYHVFE